MSDRLKLTEEDIERVLQEVQDVPPTPAVIQISIEDMPPKPPEAEAPHRHTSPVLKVTEADLSPTPPQLVAEQNLTELETLMFGLVNSARQAHLPRWMGSPNLRWHDGLAAVARGHSADMLKRQYVEHTSPEGVKVAQRI